MPPDSSLDSSKKKRCWKPKGASNIPASSVEKSVTVGWTRLIDELLSRFHDKEMGKQKDFKFVKSIRSSVLDERRDVKYDVNVSSLLRQEANNIVPIGPILNALPPTQKTKDFAVPRRKAMALISSGYIFSLVGSQVAFAQPSVGYFEYIDTFDGYSFKYPKNWIQVRGAGADIFFRDPYVLDENISVEFSSPSSSKYKSVEDLGSPEDAGKKVLKQYLIEFMSTRLGVRRESNILSTSSRIADDGKMYYQVEVNIKSYANNNELAVMPQDRVARLEWDRRYLSVLGVENNRLYELRIQSPENVFAEEENEFRQVMDSFRVNKVSA